MTNGLLYNGLGFLAYGFLAVFLAVLLINVGYEVGFVPFEVSVITIGVSRFYGLLAAAVVLFWIRAFLRSGRKDD